MGSVRVVSGWPDAPLLPEATAADDNTHCGTLSFVANVRRWGDNGYFYLPRSKGGSGEAINYCGITNYASYPVLDLSEWQLSDRQVLTLRACTCAEARLDVACVHVC